MLLLLGAWGTLARTCLDPVFPYTRLKISHQGNEYDVCGKCIQRCCSLCELPECITNFVKECLESEAIMRVLKAPINAKILYCQNSFSDSS